MMVVQSLQNLFSEGRRLKRECEGWEVSSAILMVRRVRQVLKISVREGRGAPMILLAAFTMHCRVFRQEAVQFPYHTVIPNRRST